MPKTGNVFPGLRSIRQRVRQHVRPLIGQHPSLRCFGAARRASERNLFLPVGDFDCPNAHEPFAYGTDPVGRMESVSDGDTSGQICAAETLCRDCLRRVSARQCKDFLPTLTAPAGLGLLGVASRRGFSRSGSARLGRSQKDGLPTCRERYAFRFKAINSRTREGQPGRCPFPIGRGNGRQDARPCFASRPVIHLHRRRLDLGLRYFGFGLFCARCSRHS